MKYKKIQTEQQWLNEGIAKYGAWIPNWRFKCPCCGRINTADEFDKVGLDVEDASQFCIGNFKKKQAATTLQCARFHDIMKVAA